MSTDQVVVATQVATTQEDADAVDAIKGHHSELAEQIATLTDGLLEAAESGDGFDAARAAAVDFLTGTLMPHAIAEENHLYPAAARREEAGLLVESMIAGHRVIGTLVDRIANEESPIRAAAAGHALRVFFDAHLVDENDRILSVLAGDPDVSLAKVVHGMHELLGEETHGEHGAHE
ncbi:hemerythrin domain-containing protein [Rhodococcus chondri]|uniref:Hemerythrin domain-containing protein n=1 Tax=Rhodococcus chondri TaxID=3065941 RepID=A0ABU7JWA8_9NOCA|nr:hemerythrin domain-containing protein [Rhodococcus sp. CC-R104]MEE2034292.1 hemerythrin domain-containing protein [Rhodococcus sp. CC-R104]